MRRLACLAFLAIPLMLAACSPEPAEDAAPPADAAEPLADATLDLQATGIMVPPQAGFEQLAVPFGSMRAATEATLGNVLGAAIGTHDGNGDCALQTTQYEGLTLAFNADGQFVGYFARVPYVPAMTRAEMLADPQVALAQESTLGEEFAIGSGDAVISGLFAGEADDAAVEALWAGENCIFR